MAKLLKKLSDGVKNTLQNDLVKAGACGALFLASPALPVLAGWVAVASAVGAGYFTGKRVQKAALLKTLNNNSKKKQAAPQKNR